MFKGHRSGVNSVAFSPNGRSLVSGSDDGSVRIWNIRDGSSKVLPVADSPSYFVAVVFSPDGRYVAAGHLHLDMGLEHTRAGGEVVGVFSRCELYGVYARR